MIGALAHLRRIASKGIDWVGGRLDRWAADAATVGSL